MGDLIHQLPTDEILLSREDRDAYDILFIDTEKEKAGENLPASNPLRHELGIFIIYLVLFFVSAIPLVDDLLNKFVPLCGRSWIVRAVVKALVFGLLLWIISNSSYLKV